MDKKETKNLVRDAYGRIAQTKDCCGSSSLSPVSRENIEALSSRVGYSQHELKMAPPESNMALGCGNPVAIAGLKAGEIILDLGSGGGIDCFLASQKVGKSGRIIGVDMTPEMIERAKINAAKYGYANVEFRYGEIEDLPVEDNAVDVVISNCVINLSVDKQKVFNEIYRVLKPGGRIALSDIALLDELPQKIRESIESYVGCVAGAVLVDEYKRIVEASGLREVRLTINPVSSCACSSSDITDPPGQAIAQELKVNGLTPDIIVSIYVEGVKPEVMD